MRIFLSITLLFFSVLAYSQNLALHWQANLGGSKNEYAYATTATSDGGFVVVGSTQSNKDGDVPQSRAFAGVNGNDIWVVKVNYFGQILWSRTFGGSRDDIGTSVIETKDKGLLVVGTTNSTDGDAAGNGNGSRGGLLVLKLKTDGTLEWKKLYSAGVSIGEADFQKADGTVKPAIKNTTDGGFVIAASRDLSLPTKEQDFWISRLDATGKELWNNNFGGNQDDFVNDIITCSDGGFLIVGSTASAGSAIDGAGKGFMDMYLVKTNAQGKLLWQRGFGGVNYDAAFSAVETTDKSYLIVGESNSTDADMVGNLGLKDAIVLRFSEDGKFQWKKHFGGTGNDGFYSIQRTPDGKFMAFGSTNSRIGDSKPKSSLSDAWLLKFEANGSPLSHSLFGGADLDIARNGFLTNDENFIVAGNSTSVDGDVEDNKGETDFWLIKTGNPLPVTFKKFGLSTTTEQFIKLSWETISETKAKSFGIERSNDDRTFTDLTRIFALGNSNTGKTYEFIDRSPIIGKSFYRLKYYDDAGKEYFYKTISTNIQTLSNEKNIIPTQTEVFPNPIIGEELFIRNPLNQNLKINLIQPNGTSIKIESENQNSDLITIKINQEIAAGTYFLLIENKKERLIKKIMKQ